MNAKFPQHNEDGELRRVGFEIEFIDYSLTNSVALVHNLFGGHIKKENDHLIHVDETEYGRFSIERDLNLLQDLSDKSIQNIMDKKVDVEGVANDILTALLKDVVPIEIVTPPLPFSKISVVDLIVNELKKTSAEDTSKNLFSAFGLHINPELSALDVDTILRYLRAYCLLNCWLRNEINVDISRRLSPFVDEYPNSYILLILEKSYKPDIKTLISDYVHHNKTRNRSLDMLPLFKYLNEDQVKRLLPNQSIKARPTFHYRLPNTGFRDHNWSVTKEWGRWLTVEQLANDKLLIREMTKRYFELSSEGIFFDNNQWVKETKCYLEKTKN